MPYLGEAIDSLLSQSFPRFELLVIDDGSQDATPELLQQYATRDQRVRVITRPAEGMRAAVNLGLSVARAEIIARMDADDISLTDRFEKQFQFLNTHPHVVAVGGQVWAMDESSTRMFAIHYPTDSAVIEATLLSGTNCMNHPTMMYRKAAVLGVGGYQEEYPTDDFGLWLRLIETGKLANVPDFVLQYRYQAKESSIEKHKQQQRAARRVLEAALTRRGLPLPQEMPPDYAPQKVSRIHHHWAMSAIRDGFRDAARKHAWMAVKMEPTNLHGGGRY